MLVFILKLLNLLTSQTYNPKENATNEEGYITSKKHTKWVYFFVQPRGDYLKKSVYASFLFKLLKFFNFSKFNPK